MKIAIVKLSALGDIVHAMVVLQYIKQSLPDSHIDWIVEEHFAGVLEHNPHIDNILAVNLKALKKDRLKFFSEWKKVRQYAKKDYDIVIDLQGLLKSAFVSRLLGVSAGFDKDSIRERAASFLYHHSFYIPYEENVVVRNIALVSSALNIAIDPKTVSEKEPFLFFQEKEREAMASFIKKGEKNILYVLGSSWISKVYPKEKFIEIINGLEGNHLLLWGSTQEYEYAKYIAEHTKATVMPKLDLNDLKALVSQVDLVIGGDSGPTHFAWAMNRPSIMIFGPTPSERNTMQTEINRVINSGKKIDPLKLDKTDMCIRKIDPEEIIHLAKELLS
ncbi:MAG: lipopolysaccharide heptosyltransferase [Epsilonproteobacteria bacterium (ex Lamellibrachia satsuma)]|nr:MAG: lipopolysaccharide heptosyltransferase [Epsilonproteobacteria bacterium (ex Lamellibrachia satsuma)]